MNAALTPSTGDAWSPLVDVTQRSVVGLLAETDTALARCVERLVLDLDDPNGVISAFSNYASSAPDRSS